MPYSYPDRIPKVAKNWSQKKQKACAIAANSALNAGHSEEQAIFACIAAARSGERMDAKLQDLLRQRREHARLTKRKPKRLPKAPRPIPPVSIEREYYRDLRKMTDALAQITKEEIIPKLSAILGLKEFERPKLDDASDEIERMMSGARIQFLRRFSDAEIESYARKAATKTEEHNRRQIAATFKRVLAVDVFVNDANLTATMKHFVTQNVNLIKTIPSDHFSKIENIVHRGVTQGRLTRDIAKDIQSVSGVTSRRAKFIARDQVGSFNGELTKNRQTGLGIKKYKWSTSLDERVRGNPTGLYPKAKPSHWDREGKVFSWDDPPEDGHPGMPFNCRCVPIAVFEDEE